MFSKELVASCNRGDPTMFISEPSNPVDQNAIAVCLLDGGSLGYVPREMTKFFTHKVTFGRVSSVGPNEKGLYGMFVGVRPTLLHFTVNLLPSSLLPYRNVLNWLRENERESLVGAALAKAGYRCEITGLNSEDCTLEACERWWCDASHKVARLEGLDVVCTPLAKLRQLSDPAAVKEWDKAILLIAGLNEWSTSDAQKHVLFQLEQQRLWSTAQLEPHTPDLTWRLELSWLEEQLVSLPDELLAACCSSG